MRCCSQKKKKKTPFYAEEIAVLSGESAQKYSRGKYLLGAIIVANLAACDALCAIEATQPVKADLALVCALLTVIFCIGK